MSEAVALSTGEVTPAPVTEVADNFVALMRSFARAKARFMAAAEHDVEWSAQIILRQLANEGPMRASSLAECLQSDPSTVSRQVAALVKDGLVERQADPEDGRASILALTGKAGAVIAKHEELRVQHFAGMLSEWNDRDLRRFADLLRRFTHDFDESSTNIGTEPAAHRPGSAERKY
jgi:DNA-binding MarR family transcriptional regulator